MRSHLSLVICFGLLTFFSRPLYASFADTFGASSSSIGMANQLSLSAQSAALNHYAPALLTLHESSSVELNFSAVKRNFDSIENIVVKNPTNNADTPLTQEGDVSTDYGNSYHSSLHTHIKLSERNSVGLSIYAPLGFLMEFNTGDPFLPEYVMHRARYERTQFALNLARRFGNNKERPYAFSLGMHMGMQTAANTTFNAALSGTGFGSSSDTQTKAKPSLGVIASVAKKWSTQQISSLSYTQEMKNKLKVDTQGFTANPSIPFTAELSNMLYYDPHIFRFMHEMKIAQWTGIFTLEYQDWGGYETPVTRMQSFGGLVSSDDFEQVQTRSILIPAIALHWQANESWGASLGYRYRPTPIRGDFSGPGNSIDTDTQIFALGAQYRVQQLTFHLGMQYHALKSLSVQKTDELEDGNPGRKIGDPGYRVGGDIQLVSFGVEYHF